MNPTAHLLIVGDEVLGGEVPDLNGPHLLSALGRLGVRVRGLQVLGDELHPLAEAVRQARRTVDFVLISGGIGPTHDDCTRQAVALGTDQPLVTHAEALGRLRQIYDTAMTPEEAAMADLPARAELLTVPHSPGFGFRVDAVFVFPGVPILLRKLVAANEGIFVGRPWHRRELESPVREGRIAAPLAALAAAWPTVRWGSYPDLVDGRWQLKIVLRAEDSETADRAQEALARMLREAIESPW